MQEFSGTAGQERCFRVLEFGFDQLSNEYLSTWTVVKIPTCYGGFI